MFILIILQKIICAFKEKRCVFCNTEICVIWPNGNPYIDSEYRKNLENAIKKGWKP